jgi:hypothetical protein
VAELSFMLSIAAFVRRKSARGWCGASLSCRRLCISMLQVSKNDTVPSRDFEPCNGSNPRLGILSVFIGLQHGHAEASITAWDCLCPVFSLVQLVLLMLSHSLPLQIAYSNLLRVMYLGIRSGTHDGQSLRGVHLVPYTHILNTKFIRHLMVEHVPYVVVSSEKEAYAFVYPSPPSDTAEVKTKVNASTNTTETSPRIRALQRQWTKAEEENQEYDLYFGSSPEPEDWVFCASGEVGGYSAVRLPEEDRPVSDRISSRIRTSTYVPDLKQCALPRSIRIHEDLSTVPPPQTCHVESHRSSDTSGESTPAVGGGGKRGRASQAQCEVGGTQCLHVVPCLS